MTLVDEFEQWAEIKIAKYPELDEEIGDCVAIALDEIDEGADIEEELKIAIEEINGVIANHIYKDSSRR